MLPLFLQFELKIVLIDHLFHDYSFELGIAFNGMRNFYL
jgi:hypothetical protein